MKTTKTTENKRHNDDGTWTVWGGVGILGGAWAVCLTDEAAADEMVAASGLAVIDRNAISRRLRAEGRVSR